MDWLSRIAPGSAPDGTPVLSVLGKQTYRFAHGKKAWIDEEQIDFVEADEYWGAGDPEKDALRVESDLVAWKPLTDVILIAKAHVPGGKKAGYLDIGLQVGSGRKIARVHGDRKAYVTGTGIAFTPPEPFSEMPLDYSRAYGGRDAKSDDGITYTYLKNPAGRGFVVKNDPKAVQDLKLPNIEDPNQQLTPGTLTLGRFDRWFAAPNPVGFGCVGKSTHPRYLLAGLPADKGSDNGLPPEPAPQGKTAPAKTDPLVHPQFSNGASAGLRFPYLNGDEPIKLAHLDPDQPQFSFTLPAARPKAWLDTGKGPVILPMVLHTVVIYKQTNQVALTWRGSARYGGPASMAEFKHLEFGVR